MPAEHTLEGEDPLTTETAPTETAEKYDPERCQAILDYYEENSDRPGRFVLSQVHLALDRCNTGDRYTIARAYQNLTNVEALRELGLSVGYELHMVLLYHGIAFKAGRADARAKRAARPATRAANGR